MGASRRAEGLHVETISARHARDSIVCSPNCVGLHVDGTRGTASTDLSPSLVSVPGSARAALKGLEREPSEAPPRGVEPRRGMGQGYLVNAASWLA